MIQTYFLGANSRNGFYSLYEHFPPDKNAFLHILKSGPGTGKSGFLRRIGLAAEERGLDVHYVLCSGDPDSLDGVYLPALGQAWVDGTAPHVIEPHIFGVDSNYVNLGMYLTEPFSQQEAANLRGLNQEYKSLYHTAYRYLSQYAAVVDHSQPSGISKDEARELLNSLSGKSESAGVSYRFLSAISCKGFLRLTEQAEKLCGKTLPTDSNTLSYISELAQSLDLQVILCPSPLDPTVLEWVLLPEDELAFSAIPPLSGDAVACQFRSKALEALREAKSLHDQLEAFYKEHMDFPALTAYTERTIRELFS